MKIVLRAKKRHFSCADCTFEANCPELPAPKTGPNWDKAMALIGQAQHRRWKRDWDAMLFADSAANDLLVYDTNIVSHFVRTSSLELTRRILESEADSCVHLDHQRSVNCCMAWAACTQPQAAPRRGANSLTNGVQGHQARRIDYRPMQHTTYGQLHHRHWSRAGNADWCQRHTGLLPTRFGTWFDFGDATTRASSNGYPGLKLENWL
jgi:hypothetical protein